MVLLSVDVGKHTGWCVLDDGKVVESGEFAWKEIGEFGAEIEDVIGRHLPEEVVTAIPTFRYRVILAQAKLIGILAYLCWRYYSRLVETMDSKCKYSIFGTSKVSKEEIMARYGVESEHVADARMFAEFHLSKKNNGKDSDKKATGDQGARPGHVEKRVPRPRNRR